MNHPEHSIAVTNPGQPEGLGRIREVAAYLGMSRVGVYALMANGSLPYVKLDKCRRIPWESVRRLIALKLVTR